MAQNINGAAAPQRSYTPEAKRIIEDWRAAHCNATRKICDAQVKELYNADENFAKVKVAEAGLTSALTVALEENKRTATDLGLHLENIADVICKPATMEAVDKLHSAAAETTDTFNRAAKDALRFIDMCDCYADVMDVLKAHSIVDADGTVLYPENFSKLLVEDIDKEF